MARKQQQSKIAKLKHRVKLCSQADVVTGDGEFTLSRATVLTVWAGIEVKQSSMFNREGGFAIGEANTRQTHVITTRYRRDIDIGQTAWIYEERLQSAPRWFKVLAVSDYDECWIFKCRLYQQGEAAVAPTDEDDSEYKPEMPGSAVPLPPGIKL